jgi:catechol 2,3-dioxygenase-like lactoylglutathione lyase family enzyme
VTSDVIARLAAANPVPAPGARVKPRRRRYVLVAAAAAILAPAAFAADHLLGIANEGTPVPTGDVLPGQSQLDQALRDMQVGDTMQQLGTVNGVRIYAARNAAGHICLAVDHVAQTYEKGVLCDLNDPGFPSAGDRALTFPGQLQGIAADGVATVEFVDADGNVLDSTQVVDNLFASGTRLGMGVASFVETLDADGNVLSKQPLPG